MQRSKDNDKQPKGLAEILAIREGANARQRDVRCGRKMKSKVGKQRVVQVFIR